MDYVEISNSMIVYLLCGITVAIAFVQAVLYIRMAKKMTVKANIPATVPKTDVLNHRHQRFVLRTLTDRQIGMHPQLFHLLFADNAGDNILAVAVSQLARL